MTGRWRGWPLVIFLSLTLLSLFLAAAGCGSKKGESTEGQPKVTEESGKNGTATETPRAGNVVFSTKVSSDTKTNPFQVTSSSQVLHYDLSGSENAKVTITVFSHPDGKMAAGANAFEPGPHQKTIYLKPGTYYMEILPTNCTVEVKVED